MDFAAGGELYDYINERKGLYEDEARKFFRQMVSAVHYLHAVSVLRVLLFNWHISNVRNLIKCLFKKHIECSLEIKRDSCYNL